MVEKSLLVRLLMYLTRVGERIRRVRNLTPRASSSPSTLWVVSFWSMTSRCGSWPLTVFQWSQNAMTSRAWVDEVVGAGVLGEEGQHRAGTLGAGGHVVAFQHWVAAPVHDRVEVQVEDRLLAGGQPGGDQLLVE